MKKLTLLFTCALLVALTATAFAADSSWNRVKAAGKLVIGLDDAFPPMGYRDANGKLIGFDVDAAETVGKRLGITIEWQPTAWDGVIHSLNAKKFDCIWNGMTITPERAKEVAFTKPYVMDGQVAIVRFTEKRFKGIKDLKNVKVGAQKGSSALSAVKKLPTAPTELKEYEDNPKALLDLEAGRIDVVVIDNVTGRDFIAKRPGQFKILPGFISKEPFGVAFRKEDKALRAKVQKTLDQMVKDGTMAKISRKWFAEDITNPKKW
ncbi:amino acid ABC transporter substrate-binding protein [Geotalea uraniireducens]|uniref:Amino acid ABC transporter substrate-binding protein n=1 Tax=Geotalea uraniireducens TaxID=351604 RepID=A0ABN6VXE3_9BACT|nr:amino acid ABC transporter substrate-binding protein [Geotalea uraniireducens]BDV44016.1 amino acid ABC transporter substrate-binding protein [Geotalea uraniireducens]